MTALPRGRFVTFEGVEGCGKSTQIERLAHMLARRGADPLVTKEPGGTPLGLGLRRLLLRDGETPIEPEAELLLYAADRVQHVRHVIAPALAEGRTVLCDRYLDATLAYQGHGRGIDVAVVLDVHRHPPLDLRPDRTVLLDLDPEVALDRARGRNRRLGLETEEGRFEKEPLDFHRRVREGYLALAAAAPERYRIVDAVGSEQRVGARVLAALRDLLDLGETEGGDP